MAELLRQYAQETTPPYVPPSQQQASAGGGIDPLQAFQMYQKFANSGSGSGGGMGAAGSVAAAIPVFTEFMKWGFDKDKPGGGLMRKQVHSLEKFGGELKDLGSNGFNFLQGLF